ncbi:MAG: LTA synthase family protein [Pseudomonadales bacterium]
MNSKPTLSLPGLYAKLLLLLLVICSGLRAFFYLYNLDNFGTVATSDIALAFVHGVRYDLSVTTLLLAIWLLLAMPLYLFKLNPLIRYSGYLYLPILPAFIIASNVPDTLYFPFTGRRSGAEVFAFSQDISSQGIQLVEQYWLSAALSTTAALLAGYAVIKLVKTTPNLSSKWYARSAICVLLIVFSAFSIRSSLGTKPLKPLNAFNWPSAQTGSLVLNSTFTLLRQDISQLEPQHFFNSTALAREANRAEVTNPSSVSERRANVVVLIMESFALEYLMRDNSAGGYAPFLQSLSEKSLYFPESYANGRRSIDAFPSVLAGLPPLMKEPFITSAYLGVKVEGVANVLRERGYSSWFFHGAKNGSMYIDTMSQRFGFEHFVGLNEYPNKSDFDGNWGIYDEPFLRYMADQLNTLEPPFIAGAFSLSSHNPYVVPSAYQEKFPAGTLPIHRSIGYADFALARFFERASSMPWYQNTLFVITADHTSLSDDKRFQTPLGRHRVPIVFYTPDGSLAARKRETIAQQTDIGATILGYLGLNSERARLLPFGNNLLTTQAGEAFFLASGRYTLVTQRAVATANSDFSQVDIRAKADQGALTQEERQSTLRRLQAKVQLHHNGMIENSFYEE